MRWQWIYRADPNAVKHIKWYERTRERKRSLKEKKITHDAVPDHTAQSTIRYDTNDWAGETEPKNYYNTVNGEQ